MKQVTVISGKGGTGKTSVTAAFANLHGNAVTADCDVDAANLHLIATPISRRSGPEPFRAGYQAVVDPSKCVGCGYCAGVCRFRAILTGEGESVQINETFCEGCGVCVDSCPHGALSLVERVAGTLTVSETRFGPLVHGSLGIAQPASGKLVAQIRGKAAEIAVADGRQFILVDGPPGTGCPVIASLSGVDAALIVTEPTVSGLHDLERVIELCRHFGIRSFVTVNKSDLNPGHTETLIRIAAEKGAEWVGNILFDPLFPRAIVAGQTILEYAPESDAACQVKGVWNKLMAALQPA